MVRTTLRDVGDRALLLKVQVAKDEVESLIEPSVKLLERNVSLSNCTRT